MLNALPKTNWLPLLRSMEASNGGDRGAALLRLATLAAQLHREMEAEENLAARGRTAKKEDRAHGRARGHVASATDSGPEGTEANR